MTTNEPPKPSKPKARAKASNKSKNRDNKAGLVDESQPFEMSTVGSFDADGASSDQVTPRAGAHRVAGIRAGWIVFAWAALATGVLTAAGTMGLFAYNGKLDIIHWIFPGPTASPTPTAPPTVDPAMHITILNGTDRAGLATEVATTLTADGWTIGTASNSSETNVKRTLVFYAVPTYEGAARGACDSLGSVCDIKLTNAFATSGSELTMVIGADYVAPVVPTVTAPGEPQPQDSAETLPQ